MLWGPAPVDQRRQLVADALPAPRRHHDKVVPRAKAAIATGSS